jgi:hypothetical protein
LATDQTRGDEQPEELPPPKAERSVLTNNPKTLTSPAEKSWELSGSRGRHYFIGGIALADYQQDGVKQLAALQAEEAAVDEFDYFRERGSGHRWAIARQASGDQRYRVYFQAAGRPGEWQLYHRAKATWNLERGRSAPVLLPNELTCGEALVSELVWTLPEANLAADLDAGYSPANNWILLSNFKERMQQWLLDPGKWMNER